MNTAIYLLIGLSFGIGLGLLIGYFRLNSERGKVSLLNGQIEAMRQEESRLTTLNEQLRSVTTSMAQLNTQSQEAEIKRTKAESEMRAQIENMKLGNETLLRETTKLAGALSNSQTRGKYGEAQLETLLENAGLLENVHFFKQDYRSSGSEITKPDIKIAVPGGSELFIDSKFPFDRFVEAFGTEDQNQRDEYLAQHTKDLLKHVEALSKRGYHKSQGSPDFVVLFVPFETLLSEALRIDKNFLEKAFKLNVTVATPTSMMALLRTVGYIFTRNKLAQNADDIKNVATTFLKNLTLLHGKIVAVGKAISSTAKAYEDLIPTAERTVLIPARRIHNLGVSGDKDKLAIEYPDSPGNVRELKNISEDDDFIDGEEIGEKNG